MAYSLTEQMSTGLQRALRAERIVSPRKKRFLLLVADCIIILFVLCTILGYSDPSWKEARMPLIGGLLMVSSLILSWYLVKSYIHSLLGRVEEHEGPCSIEAGRILFHHKKNLLRACITSPVGHKLFLRAGIAQEKISKLTHAFVSKELIEEHEGHITLKEIARVLIEKSEELRQLLEEVGLTQSEFIGTAEWIERESGWIRERELWWRRGALNRIPGIAKDWAKGDTPTLDHYAHDIVVPPTVRFITHNRELRKVEEILMKEKNAHVLIVGEHERAYRSLTIGLAREIGSGHIVPQLESFRVVMLESNLLAQSFTEAEGLKKVCTMIREELQRVHNIILVIDAPHNKIILESLLTIRHSKILVCVHKEQHRDLPITEEVRAGLHTIVVEPLSEEGEIALLEAQLLRISTSRYIEINYPAIVLLARYTSEENGIAKLSEIIPWARKKNIFLINRTVCEQFLKEARLMPEDERDHIRAHRLSDITKEMNVCAPAQTLAIKEISQTIQKKYVDSKKKGGPLTRLLFLGPEEQKLVVAQALARTLFGGEEAFIHISLPHYTDVTTISNTMREYVAHRPAVLIYVEQFEHAKEELREAILNFPDITQEAVLIVSSRAGERHIEWLIETGKNIEEEADAILSGIVHDGVLTQETLESFDTIALFSPTLNS